MKTINYEKMLNAIGVNNPYPFVIETEKGSIVKVSESYSEGQVVNFFPNQVIDIVEGENRFGEDNIYFQGFVKECNPVVFKWDKTTELDELLIAITGEPVPPALLAVLVHNMLRSK